MRMSFALTTVLLASCTCAPSPEVVVPESSATAHATEPPATRGPNPGPSNAAPDVSRREFGARIDTTIPLTPLGAIIASPGDHATRVVRTRGTVHRVCQRMGCWMELREGDGPAVRVPMAGHAFFLPKDCQGEPAEVEGTVVLQELSPAMRAHLGSEGATALASMVSIDARGVSLLQR